MVHLTMTTAIMQALEKLQSVDTIPEHTDDQSSSDHSEAKRAEHENAREEALPGTASRKVNEKDATTTEPSLKSPRVGNPISHSQIIDLSRQLKAQHITPNDLETLLRGSRVYIAPPPPKPELSSEYKALMARLRREQEALTYQRMTQPLPALETFAQHFPMSSSAHAFPSTTSDPFATSESDEITYADVDRQMALVFNVLVSIIACAGGIWVVARWWSTPARLALSFGGSMLVGVAEVVVYWGYVRRVGESKGKEKGKKELKKVVNTWVLGGEGKDDDVAVGKASKSNSLGTRKRVGKLS